jgi:thiamine-monophosphate kinase
VTLPENLTREQRLIELIKQITAESLIGDDCAMLPGRRLVSSDMLVEGKHFLTGMALGDLGWKSMAVNLSDIAAMGGTPEFALVNIGLPAKFSSREFRLLYLGLHECASAYGTRIVGGDITGSDLLVISITVLGLAHPLCLLQRQDAHAGDLIVVTGDFGASALGLALMREGRCGDPEGAYCLARHCRPQPRLKEARLIADLTGSCGAACMDASDGLADALLQIAAASKVAIEVDAEAIPVEAKTKALAVVLGLDPLELALYGGEDYELVACLKAPLAERLCQTGSFKIIGKVAAGSRVILSSLAGWQKTVDNKMTFQHW